MKRRTLLSSTLATLAFAGSRMSAAAKGVVDVKIDPWNQPPDLLASRFIRFPKQNEVSRQDFTRGMSKFLREDGSSQEARDHTEAFLRSKGHSMREKVELSLEDAFNIMIEDPVYAARLRLNRSNFHLHWDNPRRAFFRDADYYLGEMEKTDNSGPGSLELNPDLNMPDSTRHEIHTMPGGYVGCPFAGWTYDLGHVAGTDSLRDHGRSVGYGQTMPLPKDGNVKRILDIGCGMGESTVGIKERFPETEVWGIDVGGPMVRYAHYRAVHKGMDIHYAQRLAEDTKFPDNHFDMVGSCIVFHEIDPATYPAVLKEIYRILRPGGVYHHVGIVTDGNGYRESPYITRKAGQWVNHRHNVETWWPSCQRTNLPELMKRVGFTVDRSGQRNGMSKENPSGFPPLAAIKPA